MPVIQITNAYRGDVLKVVKACVPEGFELRVLPENTREALLTALPEADYLVASGRLRIDGEALARAPRLRMIQRTGVGLDALDLAAIARAGVPLYVNAGVNAQSVAEHTMLLILACLRRLTLIDRRAKAGMWEKQAQGLTTHELAGRTVGVIGLGHIGERVVRLLRAFGAEVLYYDERRRSEAEERALEVRFSGLEELLVTSDVVTLHCALTDETRGMINDHALARMKDGVVIVNTARGPLIDSQALGLALESGKVAFAGLDVHAQEPFVDDDPLVRSERVIATPHIGGVTRDAFQAMYREAMRNIALFDSGQAALIEGRRRI